jgi:hypothetical protein
MWEQEAETRSRKRKHKLLMALICGPIFAITIAITLAIVLFLLSLLPEKMVDGLGYVIWPAGASGCAAAATAADRLGKRFGLTPQEFAAPVAFSCVVFPLLIYGLLWAAICS